MLTNQVKVTVKISHHTRLKVLLTDSFVFASSFHENISTVQVPLKCLENTECFIETQECCRRALSLSHQPGPE